MPSRWSCGLGLILLLGSLPIFPLGAESAGQSDSHSVIPGYERFFLNESSDMLRGGLLLLAELNCSSCHEAGSDWAKFATKQAPHLDDMGTRVRPEFVRELLANPQRAKPGTAMPHVLHGGSETERQQQIEALVHFLASTGSIADTAPFTAAVKRGERLFHRVGCVACHDPQDEKRQPLSTSSPLPDLSQKYSIPGLTKFLENPLSFRPSGRMPPLNLTAEEAHDIACFLLRDLEVPSMIVFKYYEGSWEELPDFDHLPVKDSGGAVGFDVNVGHPNHFGVRFEGLFRVDKKGTYKFYVGSDDGSRLLIDQRLIVKNDGIHGLSFEKGQVQLEAGIHEFLVDYFEQAGEQKLSVEYEGPGIKRQPLESAFVTREPQPKKPRFQVDLQLADRGKQLFQSAGCAACHQLRIDGQLVASQRAAKKLHELRSVDGCLSNAPQPGVPFFSLTARQRKSLARAVDSLRERAVPPPSSADRIVQTLITFNCFACHERGGMGGVEEARNKFFHTLQPEMGDEGRIPPQLTGIGDKLRPEWLRHVLDHGAKDRPHMATRMPRFGEGNMSALAAALVAADTHMSAANEPAKSTDRKLKSVGRQLVGDKGLSCVKCHTWGDSQASGIQAISLSSMTQRLRADWFYRYLLNPQQFRPGTRMPAAWPNAQSPFPNILDGDPQRQIRAIWEYLEDGDSANPPSGLTMNPIELIATSEPIIYRNFLEGGGVRAIGVGYPEHVNLAFDAESCRLAMLWQGAFIDASLHWNGRGSGFQKPLGDNILKFPPGVPLYVLLSPDAPWPTQPARELGYQFGGYRLDGQRRPIFFYRWNDVRAEETFEPVVSPNANSLRRTVRISSWPVAHGYVRMAVAAEIEDAGEDTFVIDGDWRLRVMNPVAKPIVRTSRNRQELLMPLVPPSTEPTVVSMVLEYVW